MKEKQKIFLVIFLLLGLMIAGWSLYGCGPSDSSGPTPAPASQWTIINGLACGREINAIHGTSANNIYAVADGGILLKYNGSSWSLTETSTTESFYRIWSPSADVVYLLGSDTNKIKKYSNGKITTVYTDPDPSQHLATITGFSDSDIFVGGIGQMYHYNGTGWSTMEIDAPGYVMGLWGIDSSNVYAVDLDGGIHHYDGTNWTKQAQFDARFASVSGTATNDVYAVSMDGAYKLYHYDGTTWEGIDNSLLPTVGDLHEVWGSASNDIYVVGEGGYVIHYDGSVWDGIYGLPAVDYQGVWGTSSGNVLIGGENGVMLRKDGSSWTEELGEYRGFLDGIYGTSSTSMYFGGKKIKSSSLCNAMSYNGTTLTPVDTGSIYDIRGMWGDGSSRFFAVAEKTFNSQILQFNGSSWSTDLEVNFSLLDIWGSSITDVFAVGYTNAYDGKVMHYNGSSWSTLETFADEVFLNITGGSSNEVYISGNRNPGGSTTPVLYLYDGNTFESISLPSGTQYIRRIYYLPGAGLYAGIQITASSYKLYLYSGGTWTELASLSHDIKAIWASSGSNIFLATAGGVYRYNGSSLSGPMYPYYTTANRIWGLDENNVYMVGDHGVIMRYGQ
jgi:hypothetical protein